MGEIEKASCCRAADRIHVWAPRQMRCPVDKLAFATSDQGVASASKAVLGISS